MVSDLLVSGLLVFSPVLVLIAIIVVFRYIGKKDRKGLDKKKWEIDKLKKAKLEYGDFEILSYAYRVYENEYQSIDEIDALDIEYVIIDKEISTEYTKENEQHKKLADWKMSLVGILISFYLTDGIIDAFFDPIKQAMISDNVILYKVVSFVVFFALFADITVFVLLILMKAVYAADKKDDKIREEYLDVLLFNDKLLEIKKVIIKNRIEELKKKK
ncbi:hypothetical protein [Acetobacterium tundrae]|uniref:Uncharacterized protein n=1 Tax=Acetobacterium tundrae TaxID=132932 RepID=A0ABR6WP21_9FIRM|nr:hypothetical protein [Acetobacterium tundrae]MBC3798043.1 hypothetical protein [Acetobacterium tundrae]